MVDRGTERCKASTVGGSPCSAQPVRADGYCYWHSPALEKERAEARRRGGSNKSNAARARRKLPGDRLSLREVEAHLCGVLVDVIAGRVEVGIANASASVARAIAAVAQAGDIEERVAELEKAAGTTKGWTG